MKKWKVKKNDIIVAEISDHQLLDTNKFKTNISVLTNISPVHIDFHGTYENYKNTKKNVIYPLSNQSTRG